MSQISVIICGQLHAGHYEGAPGELEDAAQTASARDAIRAAGELVHAA